MSDPRMGCYHQEGSINLWVPVCAAGVALLVVEFINVYSIGKPKQPNNCSLIKERGIFALFPQSIVERPMERD